MDDDLRPWLYAAMIVIAFISWVFNKFQEATAEKRRAREEALHRSRRRAPSSPSSIRDAAPPAQAPPPLPRRSESSAPAQPPGSLEELLEAIGGTRRPTSQPPSRAAATTRRQSVPEPIAAKPKAPTRPTLSQSEKEALDRLRSGKTSSTPRGRKGSRLFPDIAAVRRAIIASEVLGKPKGLL
ncbi:MAG: hypothetical protein H7A53_10540 [Akkermansiaceae bacterium]|nr:hypothetical protein [Akkermansiaceae bacterium]